MLLLSGEAVAHPNFDHIIHDIALLNSLGVRLVLVHGARIQIETLLSKNNVKSQFHKGLRITENQSLETIIQAVGSVRNKIEAMLSMGIVNSPMHGSKIKVSSGNYVSAKPLGVIDGVDFHHTGECRSIDTDAIDNLLSAEHIVLISNLGFSSTGEVFNLAVEDLASEVAIALKADKLISFGADDGCLDESGNLLRELSSTDQPKPLSEEQTRIFSAAAKACEQGINRAHLISYQKDGALIQELFTRDGSGTLVSNSPYETLRQASIEDVGGIIELITPLEEQGVLVKRSREVLENEVENFTVIERDGSIIACAALYVYGEEKLAELACISVHPEYRENNRGDQLLSFLEQQAKFQGIKNIFVLTTQTAHWFQERNFKLSNTDTLPEAKQALYNLQRNSKVFLKILN